MRSQSPGAGGHNERDLVAGEELLRPYPAGIDRVQIETVFSSQTFFDRDPERQVGAGERRVTDRYRLEGSSSEAERARNEPRAADRKRNKGRYQPHWLSSPSRSTCAAPYIVSRC